MPESPFQRAARERLDQTDGRSTAGSEGERPAPKAEAKPKAKPTARAKRKPKPTSSAKNRKQKVKKRYSSAREDAQLEGVIPTTPDGAVRDEVSRGEGDVAFPALICRAVREGWLIDSAKVPKHIEEMSRIIEDAEAKDKDKVAAFKALTALATLGMRADQAQWERANPAAAGQAKGAATVAVSVQNNVLAAQVIREAIQGGLDAGPLGLSASGVASGIGGGRFDGTVEVGAASTTDQFGSDEGVDHTEQQDVDYGPVSAR